jgi:hypothetical protein
LIKNGLPSKKESRAIQRVRSRIVQFVVRSRESVVIYIEDCETEKQNGIEKEEEKNGERRFYVIFKGSSLLVCFVLGSI